MNFDSLMLMRSEWLITLLIVLLLIIKIADGDKNPSKFLIGVNILLAINFLIGLLPIHEGTLFDGMFHSTALTHFQKNVLNFGTLLISLQAYEWLRKHANPAEFYILLLSSLLGMMFMLSSGHLLLLYLGLEMSTIPVAALANFNSESKRSSEAGIKLILSSAFSTGIMLFGISMLYGAVGNLGFDNIAANLTVSPLSILAFAFIVSGFAFKMSAVPFHLWTADVYEGSPVSITTYLSVISKASVLFVFVSVLYSVFKGMNETWLYSISILAVLSMTIGNLFAMRQQNIKRLLAFSSISQVGFVLVGIAGASQVGMTAVVYFVSIYLFSNILAFGVVTAISDATGKEDLKSYRGLYKSNKFIALLLAISLFSLAGVPPTAGFFGKLFLLSSGAANGIWVVIGIAAANLIVSLYNYLRVVKIMFIDEAEGEPMPTISRTKLSNLVMIVCAIGVIVIGFISPLYDYIYSICFGL